MFPTKTVFVFERVDPTLTYIVQVKCQVFVLKQGVVGEARTLDLLEERADVPPIQDVQQHDAGNTKTHIEHSLYTVLQRHGFSLRQAELTTKTRR